MNNKRLVLILVVLLVIAISLVGVFWYLSSQQEKKIITSVPETTFQEEVADIVPQNEVKDEVIQEKVFIQELSAEEKLKNQLQQVAVSFVERYGSYSNQSDFENLEDLLSFMSADFAQRTKNFIYSQRLNQRFDQIYYGLTTKAMNSQVIDFYPERNLVKFKVITQKQEIVGGSENANVFYQDAEVEFINSGGIWKVNSLNWL